MASERRLEADHMSNGSNRNDPGVLCEKLPRNIAKRKYPPGLAKVGKGCVCLVAWYTYDVGSQQGGQI